jgi:hypothetical protein
VTDAGDILGSSPPQLLYSSLKNKWGAFQNGTISYTDLTKVNTDEQNGAVGVVFNDFKVITITSFCFFFFTNDNGK